MSYYVKIDLNPAAKNVETHNKAATFWNEWKETGLEYEALSAYSYLIRNFEPGAEHKILFQAEKQGFPDASFGGYFGEDGKPVSESSGLWLAAIAAVWYFFS